jgi:phage-related protein
VTFTVEYVELEGGNAPFLEFVRAMNDDDQAKIFQTIDRFVELKSQNLSVKENLSKHLEDGIFELRTSFPDKIARSFYFYRIGARIVITHGFIKKTEKTPRKEIERAKELRSLYFTRRE